MNTVVHPFGDRFTIEQLFRIPIKQKIDSTHVNAEVIRLREKHAVREATWNCLMSVTGDKGSDIRKFGG